jgi:hypothetical protein
MSALTRSPQNSAPPGGLSGDGSPASSGGVRGALVTDVAMPKGLSAPDQRKWPVSTIKTALVAESETQQTVSTAQAECASRSKRVGILLLEAKKLHTTTFGEILLQVGHKLSREYDLMRLAGGRTTDEELKRDARERKQKSRAEKLPTPDSVTEPMSRNPSTPTPLLPGPTVAESADGAEAGSSGWENSEVGRLIMKMSHERAHDLLLWLTDHLIAISPEHGAATKKKAA